MPTQPTPDGPREPPVPFTEREWLAVCTCVGLLAIVSEGETSAMGKSCAHWAEKARQAIHDALGQDYILYLKSVAGNDLDDYRKGADEKP